MAAATVAATLDKLSKAFRDGPRGITFGGGIVEQSFAPRIDFASAPIEVPSLRALCAELRSVSQQARALYEQKPRLGIERFPFRTSSGETSPISRAASLRVAMNSFFQPGRFLPLGRSLYSSTR